jgi:soluble lytic murein transglycosylase-like protein
MVRVQAAIVPAAIAGCFIVACLGVFATSNSADLSMLQPVLAYADSPGQAAPAQDNPAAAPQGTAADVPADCALSSAYPESIRQWCALIMQSSAENNLDPNLVAAVMLQESGGNPLAYSHSGAVGLMQVMPRDGLAANFTCANGPCFSSRPTITELQDPAFNIAYGTRMLAGLIGKYGDLRDALRYYGPGNSGYSYADIVLRIFQRYQ